MLSLLQGASSHGGSLYCEKLTAVIEKHPLSLQHSDRQRRFLTDRCWVIPVDSHYTAVILTAVALVVAGTKSHHEPYVLLL